MSQLHDIGGGVFISYYVSPRYKYPQSQFPDDEDGYTKVGIIVEHKDEQGNACSGSVPFYPPQDPSEHEANRPYWTVESTDPLTISPSILCHCGKHGFIREGRWSEA